MKITATATKEGTVYASDTSTSDIVVTGNGATAPLAVTANVTPIKFTEVTDTNNAWDGETFTAPEKGIYHFNGVVHINSAVQSELKVWENKTGSFVSGVSVNTNIANVNLKLFSGTFIAGTTGDQFQIRSSQSVTLAGATNFHHITITKAASNIDNFIVDVGTKHVTGGEEYPTGDTLRIGGVVKPIYARMWVVGTDVTATNASYIAGLPTNITHYDKFSYTSESGGLFRYASGDNALVKSTGEIAVYISGAYELKSGTKIYLPYTKD